MMITFLCFMVITVLLSNFMISFKVKETFKCYRSFDTKLSKGSYHKVLMMRNIVSVSICSFLCCNKVLYKKDHYLLSESYTLLTYLLY